MQKVLLLIGVICVFLTISFIAFNNYIYNQKQASNPPITSYQATLSGEYLCLPHKDQSGPQTLECALGLQTAAGEYYAIDFTQVSEAHSKIKTGDQITASGTIVPIEMLSTDHWQKYPIEGIFSITSLQE